MRGGFSNRVSVKYERIPLFCFHCGKLGHGTKDCDDFHGEGSPTKNFNRSLKAFPWCPVREHLDGDSAGSGRARRLFVVKPVSRSIASPVKKSIESVTSLLNSVGISPAKCDGSDKEKGGLEGVSGGSSFSGGQDAMAGNASKLNEAANSAEGPLKKWKRRKRGGLGSSGPNTDELGFLGEQKRPNDHDSRLFYSDFNDEVPRKRVMAGEEERVFQSDTVAGSTCRALGDL